MGSDGTLPEKVKTEILSRLESGDGPPQVPGANRQFYECVD